MGVGERITNAIEAYRDWRRKHAGGAYGAYYRDGGNSLLYDVPVETDSLVLDAGGYEGEWTANMIARYGCRSEVFEPVPAYAERCRRLFSRNTMVNVHEAALGNASRMATFHLSENGTSEYGGTNVAGVVEVPVVDVLEVFNRIPDEFISCVKLNIEGGEYDVLERLLDTGLIKRCGSLLIQFHPQPAGWETRLRNIEAKLMATHVREWCYPLLWEKWIINANR